MTQNSLEIIVLYYSNEGREVRFTDLVSKQDVMDENHYELSSFWNALGGFDVTINGHFTIFHSCSFYCLIKATSFLIHSLYWIKNKKSDWFDTDESFPNDVLVKPTPNTILRLQRLESSDILVSYLPIENDNTRKRGDRYFSGIKLNIDDWFEQTNFALSEYFKILMLVIERSDKTNRLLQTATEYMEVWQAISKN